MTTTIAFIAFAFIVSCQGKGVQSPCPLNEPDVVGPLRVCYYTTWARYRPAPFNMAVEDFDPRMCSHVIIAFAWITNGRLAFHSEYDDKHIFQELVRFKKHFPKLKVSIINPI